MAITVVQRKPRVKEFQSIVASVGFRAHDKAAVEIALRNTVFSVSAIEEEYIVGLGRVVGDGAISSFASRNAPPGIVRWLNDERAAYS